MGADSPILTTADVDLTRLANQPTPSVPAQYLPTAAQALGLLSAGLGIEQDTFAVRAETIQDYPAGLPPFSGDIWFNDYRGTTNKLLANLILLLNFDHWSATEKADCPGAMIQHAIDIAGRAKAGGVWQDNGGHCLRKFLVAFAASLTDHALFTEALAYTTTELTFGSPGPVSIWSDDRQVFTVDSTHVALAKFYSYTTADIGMPEWSSAPVFSNPVLAGNEFQNDLDFSAPPRSGRNMAPTVSRHHRYHRRPGGFGAAYDGRGPCLQQSNLVRLSGSLHGRARGQRRRASQHP